MSGVEPQGAPAGGSSLSNDDDPTANDGTAGADAAAGDASTNETAGHDGEETPPEATSAESEYREEMDK